MKTLRISLFVMLVGLASATPADEFGALITQCDGCHGPQGASSHSDVPIIGGQSPEFLEDTLRSFQMWGRPCIKSAFRHGDTSRPTTDMCKIAETLSDEQITMLAAHYAKQPFVAARQKFDASQVATGAALHEKHCENCHEQGGASVAGRGPRTAGQWTDYLKATLKFVPTGEHQVPRVMERGLGNFSATELDALMNFYASQQPRE